MVGYLSHPTHRRIGVNSTSQQHTKQTRKNHAGANHLLHPPTRKGAPEHPVAIRIHPSPRAAVGESLIDARPDILRRRGAKYLTVAVERLLILLVKF
jgi:hypothetical protein